MTISSLKRAELKDTTFLSCHFTFPHTDGNAPGQVQQCDTTKIICYSSQCVAWGQTDSLAMAPRVWETKSRTHKSGLNTREGHPNIRLPISTGHYRGLVLHVCVISRLVPDP